MRRKYHGPLPLARVLRNMRESHEREALSRLNQQVGAQEALKEVMGAIESGNMQAARRIPQIMMQAFQDRESSAEAEEEEVIRENRELLVYRSAALYLEQDGPNFTVIDFGTVLEGMETIHYSAPSDSFTVTKEEGDTTTLKGRQGQAFLRYLRFLGLFEAIRLRKDCPHCVLPEWLDPGMDPEHPERPCAECGGLAWVLDDGE